MRMQRGKSVFISRDRCIPDAPPDGFHAHRSRAGTTAKRRRAHAGKAMATHAKARDRGSVSSNPLGMVTDCRAATVMGGAGRDATGVSTAAGSPPIRLVGVNISGPSLGCV